MAGAAVAAAAPTMPAATAMSAPTAVSATAGRAGVPCTAVRYRRRGPGPAVRSDGRPSSAPIPEVPPAMIMIAIAIVIVIVGMIMVAVMVMPPGWPHPIAWPPVAVVRTIGLVVAAIIADVVHPETATALVSTADTASQKREHCGCADHPG